jgi:PhoH-like ATPase
MSEPKNFVIDTSVLMHNPKSIEELMSVNNTVHLPIWVLEELDKLKLAPNGRGAMAREAIREIKRLKEQCTASIGESQTEFISKKGGRIVFNYRKDTVLKKLPPGLEKKNDNRILGLAKSIQASEKEGKKVILISKDIAMCLKAEGLGIIAQDYQSDKVLTTLDELYTGLVSVEIPLNQEGLLTTLGHEKKINIDVLKDFLNPKDLMPNQCLRLVKESNGLAVLAIFNKQEQALVWAGKYERQNKENRENREGTEISPRNDEQQLAFAMLMDPKIELVTLAGKAGTGKTLLALLAAYKQLSTGYEKIQVYRPIIELGSPLGFLPGEIEEKFAPWMKPIIHALNLIGRRPPKSGGKNKGATRGTDLVEDLTSSGLLDIAPFNYVRGLTVDHAFIIIDEAQNLTPHEIVTLVTRAGEGTKIVLTGDPTQIDNRYLDETSNGLCYIIQTLKEAIKNAKDSEIDEALWGHITMLDIERSPLARFAAINLHPLVT